MAEAADPGDPTNGGGVAPCGLSAVLEMPLQNRTTWRAQACRQGNTRADLSYGCGEPKSAGHLPEVERRKLTLAQIKITNAVAKEDRNTVSRNYGARPPFSQSGGRWTARPVIYRFVPNLDIKITILVKTATTTGYGAHVAAR